MLNDTLDKDGGPPHVNRNSKEKIKSYMDFFNLRDVFRDFNPSKKIFTRIQIQPYTATRLDFFLVSDNLYLISNRLIYPKVSCLIIKLQLSF